MWLLANSIGKRFLSLYCIPPRIYAVSVLKTVGSGFIRALSIALGDELNDSVITPIDDLLITSHSFEQHC